MGFDSIGAPQFGIKDAKIATWNATDDYGTAVDVPSIQLLETTLRIVSAELEGDDEITATASRAIGAECRMRWGSVSIAALEVLLGIDSVESGSPATQDHLKVTGGANMPYIGIVGKMIAEEGEGDFHVFIPKVKVMSDMNIASGEYGQFSIPEVTLMGVPDATYEALNLVPHSSDTEIAIPPTNIS